MSIKKRITIPAKISSEIEYHYPESPVPDFIPDNKAKIINNNSRSKIPPLRHFVYIWFDDGTRYWTYPTHIEKCSIAGWLWSGKEWVRFRAYSKVVKKYAFY